MSDKTPTDNAGSQALRRKLAERGAQTDAAAAIGISQSRLSRLEAGEKPGREHALVLLRVYKIPIDAWDKPAEPEPDESAEPRPGDAA